MSCPWWRHFCHCVNSGHCRSKKSSGSTAPVWRSWRRSFMTSRTSTMLSTTWLRKRSDLCNLFWRRCWLHGRVLLGGGEGWMGDFWVFFLLRLTAGYCETVFRPFEQRPWSDTDRLVSSDTFEINKIIHFWKQIVFKILLRESFNCWCMCVIVF